MSALNIMDVFNEVDPNIPNSEEDMTHVMIGCPSSFQGERRLPGGWGGVCGARPEAERAEPPAARPEQGARAEGGVGQGHGILGRKVPGMVF